MSCSFGRGRFFKKVTLLTGWCFMNNNSSFPFGLPLILDGATGTELQKRGMPVGACPESFVLSNPETIIDIQRAYVEAGSEAVLAPTFGCNRASLKRYDLHKMTREYNLRLVDITRSAVGDRTLIGGDMSPCGLMMEPLGEYSFDDIAEIYAEQAESLLEAGVDFFMPETQMSEQEAKAALSGIRSISDKPVFVSFTLSAVGTTLWGEKLSDIAPSFEALGASAFGVNCCGDLKLIETVLAEIREVVNIPVIAKPNAGMPRESGGLLVYDMTAAELAQFAARLAGAGALIIGGCCGTSYEHIAEIAEALK